MTAPDEAMFATLSRRISEAAGLPADVYKDKCLRRRIAVRMRACGVHAYSEYLAVLQRADGEAERLRDTLTINVTRFYRNAETWDLLRTGALRALWLEREGHVRVWSAGCASGEEPYTVAMVVAEIAREAGRSSWVERTQIDATDVDRASLERSAEAIYRADALSELPSDLSSRYLTTEPGGYRVVEALRGLVSVRRLELGAEAPLRTRYDVILCRNVVIYFDRAMQERLFGTFADALAPGGILVLGKVETLLGAARERFEAVDTRERIYRRVP